MNETRACRRWRDGRFCGNTEGVQMYAAGLRCPTCTPAAVAGRPEASGQYCAAGRHYCLATDTPCPTASGSDQAVTPSLLDIEVTA